MPVSTHRTFTWFSTSEQLHCPFELLPYQSQSSMDLSWMLKGSIPTSGFNSKMKSSSAEHLNNQSDPQWALDPDRWTLPPQMHLCSKLWAISDSMFSRTHMATPLQDIPSDEDTSPSLVCTTTGLDFHSMSRTTASCEPSVPAQTCVPQTLQTSQATSDSQEALEFHLHGFHNEAPSIFQAIPWS